MNPTAVLQYPLNTEKAVHLMNAENKLLFVIAKKATKADVKKAFELLFKTKVTRVGTYTSPDGKKRAYITLAKDVSAIDIFSKMGIA